MYASYLRWLLSDSDLIFLISLHLRDNTQWVLRNKKIYTYQEGEINEISLKEKRFFFSYIFTLELPCTIYKTSNGVVLILCTLI